MSTRIGTAVAIARAQGLRTLRWSGVGAIDRHRAAGYDQSQVRVLFRARRLFPSLLVMIRGTLPLLATLLGRSLGGP